MRQTACPHATLYLEAVACVANTIKKIRGVAGGSTKFHDRKGDEAYAVAAPHPLRVHVNLGLLTTAQIERLRETGGLKRRAEKKPWHREQSSSFGFYGSARHPHSEGGHRCRWGVKVTS
jgi:hypothetical protein